jgi:hypothetical protein
MGRIEKQKRKLIEEANKRLLGLITEDTEDKIAILFDGTSSAGKSYTAKQLNARHFWEVDPTYEGWVVIDSDDFGGRNNDEEKRRLKLDHPNIRDWAEGFDSGIVSGLYRKGDPEKCIKNLEKEAKKEGREVNPSDIEKCKNIPNNPYEDEYIEGTDPRLWYMAQEFKTVPWKKVIFDDIGNGIEKYIPNIKSKLLIHSPIEVMLGNIKSRNDEAVKQNDESLSRNPKVVLGQYLEKYEATTSKPDLTVGDPTTDITKKGLKTALMDAMTDNYPDYDEEYIDGFIDDLGVKDDNATHWIKVKDNYLSDDQVLINVGDDQQTYITDIKEKYFTNEK